MSFEFEPEITTISHETSQISFDFSTEPSTPETTMSTTTTTATPTEDELDFSKFVPASEPSRDFSKILIEKAKARPKNFTDAIDGLSVPGSEDDISSTPIFFDEHPIFVDVNSPTPPFSDDFFFEGSTESTTTQHQVETKLYFFLQKSVYFSVCPSVENASVLMFLSNSCMGQSKVGNCDSFVKRKILVINETKRDEILLKPKV